MPERDTFTFIAGTYEDVAAAVAGFERVKDVYHGLDLMDTFDAAVLGKKANGTLRIYDKHEQPARHGGRVGAGWGLATGMAVALFPAIGIGAVGWTAATGACLGAISGHVVGGMSRSDLKELGEHLDGGQATLVVAAVTDVADDVATAMGQADKVVRKPGRVDAEKLQAELVDTERAVDAMG